MCMSVFYSLHDKFLSCRPDCFGRGGRGERGWGTYGYPLSRLLNKNIYSTDPCLYFCYCLCSFFVVVVVFSKLIPT